MHNSRLFSSSLTAVSLTVSGCARTSSRKQRRELPDTKQLTCKHCWMTLDMLQSKLIKLSVKLTDLRCSARKVCTPDVQVVQYLVRYACKLECRSSHVCTF